MEEVINGILICEVETKNIMTKSSLPVGGYSVNPYVGCTHACKYCPSNRLPADCHDKKGNRGHNEDAEDAHCDTLDDVLCHRLMPLHSYQ